MAYSKEGYEKFSACAMKMLRVNMTGY